MMMMMMSINRPSRIVESVFRSLRNVWVYWLLRYITKPTWPQYTLPLCMILLASGMYQLHHFLETYNIKT